MSSSSSSHHEEDSDWDFASAASTPSSTAATTASDYSPQLAAALAYWRMLREYAETPETLETAETASATIRESGRMIQELALSISNPSSAASDVSQNQTAPAPVDQHQHQTQNQHWGEDKQQQEASAEEEEEEGEYTRLSKKLISSVQRKMVQLEKRVAVIETEDTLNCRIACLNCSGEDMADTVRELQSENAALKRRVERMEAEVFWRKRRERRGRKEEGRVQGSGC
ncbi:hypothetical protein FN846DRAFT_946981 [Sphaerosporella brunnea]|uniref:Uncharacterized protein n=1 Tax=Sphaerosporella brunnea TaxID=1250544 RepID=A0A5J5EXU0_9PEZI|nr:hypothetical protein FN846DRAFT_946981 [Sphaerosporella brunnea]